MNTFDLINAGPKNRFTVNGRVVSNSGRIIQLQNLKRNELSTLDEARELVKMGAFDMLASIYGNVPDVLSQLCRTMLIPKEGHEFIVADFSAIEARVLAFLAGEEWRLEAFRNGEDIYCASASAMFGVRVVKHGENGELRAKGKVAELACLSFNSPVLTNCGLIPIQNVTKEMKVWDGEEWVSHDGVVYKGEREVIEYEGLTATPDHLVFIEGRSSPVSLKDAVAGGYKIIQTGDSGGAIRLSEDYLKRINLSEEDLEKIRSHTVPELRNDRVERAMHSQKENQRKMLPLSSWKSTQVARAKINFCKATMRKPKGPAVSQLWGKRHQIQVSKCDRSWTLFDSRVWTSREGFRTRPNQQQRRLCCGKFKICHSETKQRKPKNYRFKQIRSRMLAICGNSGQTEISTRTKQGRNHSGCQESCHREEKKLARNTRTVKVYDILNAGRHHRFTVSGKLVHNCGYQGGPGALVAMGALDMGLKEDELQGIIDSWREANPNIVKFWWDLERAAIRAIDKHEENVVGRIGVEFSANTLWLVLPSGRRLAYIRPKVQPNKFGRSSVTYEGLSAANKWVRGETYGGKLAENCLAKGTLVATSRGAIPIEDVKKSDMIFDGVELVRHDGVVAKGVKPVIEIGGADKTRGLEMTPDHKILTSQGWRQASEGGCWDDGDPIVIRNSHAEKPVYDIKNCGKRHRFAVFDGDKIRIVSNCTQATARDLLAEAMRRMEQAGLDIVGHVHDEVVLETPMNTVSVEDVCEIMNQNPDWAEGLPLASAGFKGKYYFKD